MYNPRKKRKTNQRTTLIRLDKQQTTNSKHIIHNLLILIHLPSSSPAIPRGLDGALGPVRVQRFGKEVFVGREGAQLGGGGLGSEMEKRENYLDTNGMF